MVGVTEPERRRVMSNESTTRYEPAGDRWRDLRAKILKTVGERGTTESYAPLAIEGVDVNDVDTIVCELYREGLLHAMHVPRPLGPKQPTWLPSGLTDRGRRQLSE